MTANTVSEKYLNGLFIPSQISISIVLNTFYTANLWGKKQEDVGKLLSIKENEYEILSLEKGN